WEDAALGRLRPVSPDRSVDCSVADGSRLLQLARSPLRRGTPFPVQRPLAVSAPVASPHRRQTTEGSSFFTRNRLRRYLVVILGTGMLAGSARLQEPLRDVCHVTL